MDYIGTTVLCNCAAGLSSLKSLCFLIITFEPRIAGNVRLLPSYRVFMSLKKSALTQRATLFYIFCRWTEKCVGEV